MGENMTQGQVTEQAGQNGTAEEAEVARGPFEQQAEAEAAFEAAKATGKPYKLWTIQAPGKPTRWTVAIDSQRAIKAAAVADGCAASRIGGKKAVVTAADVGNFLANMTDEERAEYLKQYLPKKGGKGGK